jgi:hypothetical protein
VITVGDDYPRQQARVRMIRDHAQEIGPAGAFLVAICDDVLRRADAAAIGGDVVAIMRVYQEMREMKE